MRPAATFPRQPATCTRTPTRAHLDARRRFDPAGPSATNRLVATAPSRFLSSLAFAFAFTCAACQTGILAIPAVADDAEVFDDASSDVGTNRDDTAGTDLGVDAGPGCDGLGPPDAACAPGNAGQMVSGAEGFEWFEGLGVSILAPGDEVHFAFAIIPFDEQLTLVGADDAAGATAYQLYFEDGEVRTAVGPAYTVDVGYVEGEWTLVHAAFRLATRDVVVALGCEKSAPMPVPAWTSNSIAAFRVNGWTGGVMVSAWIDSLSVRIVGAAGDETVLLEEDFDAGSDFDLGSGVLLSAAPPGDLALPEVCE